MLARRTPIEFPWLTPRGRRTVRAQEDAHSSSPPMPVSTVAPAACSRIGAWKCVLNGHNRPWRVSAARAYGPTASSSSATSTRIQSVRPRCRTTVSCQSDSCDCGAALARMVTGTGGTWPSRRATSAAAASTADESRPPEKDTNVGPRSTAGRTAASRACAGESVDAGSGDGAPPKSMPVASSTGVSTAG